MESQGFKGLGIAEKILGILEKNGFKTPTPIQLKSIPVTMEGNDVVGIAQTGTGKTLAFGVPMLQRLAIHKGRGLAILPTRELAIQVDESLQMIGKEIGLRTAVLIGGEPLSKQIKALRAKPHIIVATPGRLINHIDDKNIDLGDVKILVLDEADMMFDMGFAPQIERILRSVPKDRQTLLFSATMPPEILEIVRGHMRTPVSVEVAPAGTTSENIEQEMIVVTKEGKLDQLLKILTETKGSVLIFSRTKHNAKKLNIKLNQLGHKSSEIHSNRSLPQRREALAGFKGGKYRILVATDIAARGIDVQGIETVVNFDLPDDSGDYVHRIGRTGRADLTGKAVSFVLPEQIGEIKAIEKLIKKSILVTSNGQKVELSAQDVLRSAVSRKKPGGRGMKPARTSAAKTEELRRKPSFQSRHREVKPVKKDAFSASVDITSAFNPFKDEIVVPTERMDKPSRDRRPARRALGSSSRNERSKPKSSLGLTDKQRFRNSMKGRP